MEYNNDYMGNLIQSLIQNDGIVQKVFQDYLVYGTPNSVDGLGNTTRNQRLILLSPNGTYFQILVDDSGNLTTLNLGT
jgi:hypothetical protein